MQTNQKGLTAWGMIIIIALIGFFTLLAVRLVPVYLENYKVTKSLDTLLGTAIEDRSSAGLMKMFMRRMEVNDIEHVRQQDIKMEKQDNGFVMDVNYEVRVPIIGNVDAVVKFHNRQEIPAR